MSFYKKFVNLVSPPRPEKFGYPVAVRCSRCGEEIQSRINLANDLSVEYDDRGKKKSYFCRKVLMGTGQCFERIEIELVFDPQRRLIEKKISGGKFLEDKDSSR